MLMYFISTEPLPPQLVTFMDVTRSSFVIEWAEPQSGNWDGYVIEYTPPEGQPETFSPQNRMQPRQATVTGLNPGTEYTVFVRSYADNTAVTSEPASNSQMTSKSCPENFKGGKITSNLLLHLTLWQ